MNIAVVANLVIFALALGWLAWRATKRTRLSTNVLVALLLGVVLGAFAHAVYGACSSSITATIPWVNVIGS